MSEGSAAAGWPPGEACRVRLDSFEGPLDLLVHLIRTEAIDIADVPLAIVARQYDHYLDLMRDLDLEAAGESLVLVAALIHMKSRRLLPPDPAQAAADLEAADRDLERTPPDRQGLREVAEHLQEREAVMELLYPRPAGAVAEYAGEQGIEADLFSLLRAFQAILKRIGDDPAAHVTRERITLAERMNWLVEILQQERRVTFRALFVEVTDRLSCILTFLALLEVIRLRLVRAYQSHHQEDILIILADDAPHAPTPAEGATDV